jgi:hypothetical protein
LHPGEFRCGAGERLGGWLGGEQVADDHRELVTEHVVADKGKRNGRIGEFRDPAYDVESQLRTRPVRRAAPPSGGNPPRVVV